MRIKKRGVFVGLFTAFVLCGLALLLLFLPADNAATAFAAATPRYSVYFDYKYYGGSSLSDREPTPQLNTEKNNVLKSDAHICKKGVNQNTCEVKIELYGSGSDGSTGTLSQGGTIKSKTVNITASSEYNENAFQIKNASGGVVASSSSKSIQATLTDGTYYVTFTGNSRWEQESVARTVIRVAVIECTFSFKIDDMHDRRLHNVSVLLRRFLYGQQDERARAQLFRDDHARDLYLGRLHDKQVYAVREYLYEQSIVSARAQLFEHANARDLYFGRLYHPQVYPMRFKLC